MRRRRILIVAVALVTALAAVLAWVWWPRPTTLNYVTAPAARGSIAQTLTLVGPVEREGQAVLEYTTHGLVTALHVRPGDQVAAGQQLVTVDAAPLRLAVLQARAQLAQAQAQLDADLTARDAGSGRPSLPGGPASPGGLPPGGTPPAGMPPISSEPPRYLTEMDESLVALQAAVTDQQTQCAPVFELLQEIQDLDPDNPPTLPFPLPSGLPTALPTVSGTTPPAGPAPGTRAPSWPAGGVRTATEPTVPRAPATDTPAPSPSGTPTLPVPTRSATPTPPVPTPPAPSPTPTSTGTPPAPSARPTPTGPPPTIPPELFERLQRMAGQIQACSQSMVTLAEAEGRAGRAIGAAVQGFAQSTQQAQAAIAAAYAELEQTAQRMTEEALRRAEEQLKAQLAGQFGGVVTDATIARDRATLLQARQALESAEADLAGATMTSPISGTVGAMDFAVGEGTAGRSITVVGEGAARITVDVPLASRAKVAPGVAARVGQLAAPATLSGQVTSVSVLPANTSGTPAYATRVLTDDTAQTLYSGSYAQVTLLLAQAGDVLTIPASAVTTLTDTTGTVEVLPGPYADTAETRTVVLGRHGEGRIEIVSGLVEGEQVVLADRRLPVPGGMSQYSQQPER